jgi:hypothetical protein
MGSTVSVLPPLRLPSALLVGRAEERLGLKRKKLICGFYSMNEAVSEMRKSNEIDANLSKKRKPLQFNSGCFYSSRIKLISSRPFSTPSTFLYVLAS